MVSGKLIHAFFCIEARLRDSVDFLQSADGSVNCYNIRLARFKFGFYLLYGEGRVGVVENFKNADSRGCYFEARALQKCVESFKVFGVVFHSLKGV